MLANNGKKESLWKRLDYWTIALYLLLVSIGWFLVVGASYSFDEPDLFTGGSRPMMQLLWIGLSGLLVMAVLHIRSDIYEVIAKPVYLAMLLLLLATIFLAPNIKGSHSWLVLGPIRLQPAEFAKMTTALMLAHTMSRYGFKLQGIKNYLWLFTIILVPMGIIFLQSEAGSALVFFSFFLVLYREGMTGFFLGVASWVVILFVSALSFSDKMQGAISLDLLVICTLIMVALLVLLAMYTRKNSAFIRVVVLCVGGLLLGYCACVYFFPMFNYAYVLLVALVALIGYCLFMAVRLYAVKFLVIAATGIFMGLFSFSVGYVYEEVLKPHQRMRIGVALGLETDVQGVGYNVNQAKIAIGSGGFSGKGFHGATQTKLKYVPEQDTDFIFCTVAEEYGFLGSATLLFLFLALILRLMYLSQRLSAFGRVYGYCIACILLMHISINVGMVLGLVPVIGIPLPFCSYGGSSLWSFSLMLFIFLRIYADR